MVVKCNICSKEFTLKKNLYAHTRKIHKVNPMVDKNRKNLVCSLCSCISDSYVNLRDHYICVHDYEIYCEQVTFQSKTDFMLWKERKEKELRCSYIQASGTQPSSNGQKTYYICHRSFVPKRYKTSTQEVRTKRTKSQGSAKSDYTCPSTMELVETNQIFQAKLFLPHIGHECDLRHLKLTRMEKTAIAGKISEGVSFDQILEDIRNSITSKESLERISLLDRQDLRNIKKQFGLNRDQYHQDDVICHLRSKDIKEEDKDKKPLQAFIADHNKSQQLQSSSAINDELLNKLDLLYGYIEHNTISDESAKTIAKMLDNVLKVAKSEPPP